jgi:ATP-binding cassette subfamily C protein LapB
MISEQPSGPDEVAETQVVQDLLAHTLTRLAALQGHAVPWHRFAMMGKSASGAVLADMPAAERALELWSARFPTGLARSVRLPLTPDQTPALWVAPNPEIEQLAGAVAFVVRGALSSGALSCLDSAGKPCSLSAEVAGKGTLLQLECAESLEQSHEQILSGTDDTGGKRMAAKRSATQWFRHAIAKRWVTFMEGSVATLTVNVVALGASFYSMQVYDRVVPTQGYSTLWVLTVGVLMAILLELGMRQLRNRLVERACKAIDEELSGVFFGHALAIRMDQRPRTVGTFAAQIRHFEMVRNFMTSSTLFLMADAPFALLFVAVIAILAGPVAIIPLAFIPISVLAGLIFRNKLRKLTEVHMRESNLKNGLLIEAIDGIESVKASGAEWKMLDRWRELTHTLAEDEIAIKNTTNLSNNLTQTLQQLSYIGLVAAGVFAINNGSLTMGGLIACTIISGRALSPIAQISSLIVQWQQASIALRGLDGIMSLPADSEPGERRLVPDRCSGRLQLKGVKFGYTRDVPVLTVDEMVIRPGERVAVLGNIGSGKSTLVKVLSGLYKPADGRTLLDDVDMAQLAPEFVREHIGYLSQDVRLFQGTLRDNLALGLPSPSDEQILAASRITGLDKLIASHPAGLGIEISEGGRGLSGGQRQLVGLTRLVIAQPRVMLLDEPTASMDPQLEEQVAERIFGLRPNNTTLVVVTHKPAMLKHFTRVVIVDRGRIVADGPRDEVLRRLRETVQAQQQAATKAAVDPSAPPITGIAPVRTVAA